MNAAFTITPVEKGIVRCRHSGPLSHEDIQSLASFLYNYHGKLLVDLSGTSAEECSRHIKQLRPMMPITAIFGAELDPEVLEFPESYAIHDVQYFQSEDEALTWLRNQ